MAVVLALDISSKVGWATMIRGQLCFGMYEVKAAGEGEDLGCFGFGIWLRTMIRENKPDIVAIESPIPPIAPKGKPGVTNFQTLKILYGLVGVARFVTMQSIGRPAETVYASTARKTVTGSGATKKPEVIKFLRAQGYRVAEDNAADALVIYLHTIMTNGRGEEAA